jgi:hypothetical protein
MSGLDMPPDISEIDADIRKESFYLIFVRQDKCTDS